MKKIFLFALSLSFFLVWGLGFLDIYADKFTAIMAFIYTILAPYFLHKKFNFEFTKLEKGIVLSMPFIYLAMYTYLFLEPTLYGFSRYLQNPLLAGFIILFLMLNYTRDLVKPANAFVILFGTVFYFYTMFPEWKRSTYFTVTENFDTDTEDKKKEEKTLNEVINLNDYLFINAELDTVKAISQKDFILIETWNETCPPCILAFKDLHPFYEKNKDQLDYFYVYEHRKASVREKFEKIFNFKPILSKSKILIDIEQNLFSDSEMNAYPYFVLFDKNGNVLFHQRGYARDSKSELEDKILEHISI